MKSTRPGTGNDTGINSHFFYNSTYLLFIHLFFPFQHVLNP